MSILEKISKVFDFAIKHEANIKKALHYFIKYRYLLDGDIDTDKLITIIKGFQRLAGITESGIIDAKTLAVMDWPRCSLHDAVTEEASNLAKWKINDFRYYLSGYDTEISRGEWSDSFKQAWANIRNSRVNITAEEVKDPNDAHFIIGVGQGAKDDFDGSSGTLAWFQLPPTSNFLGKLQGKFDLAETWIPVGKKGRGIYLVNVACHEIIHGLGLNHSSVKSALMAPFYTPEIDRPQDNDDIPRLQSRYGVLNNPIPQPTPTPVPVPIPVPSPTPTDNETIIRITGLKSIAIDGYRLSKIG